MLYRHEGFVQTQALYSMEAPWLPKSESGTKSPSLHLRHRGNAFSTKSPPSFPLEDSTRQHDLPPYRTGRDRRGCKPRGSLRLCIRVPTTVTSPYSCYHTTHCLYCQQENEVFFISLPNIPQRHLSPGNLSNFEQLLAEQSMDAHKLYCCACFMLLA